MSIAPIVETLPLLSRIARAALDWSQIEASRRAGMPKTTLARFETSTGGLSVTQCAKLIEAYEDAGVIFIEINGGIGITLSDSAAAIALDQLHNPVRRRSDYKGSR